jgi:tape measure domain-containing protein
MSDFTVSLRFTADGAVQIVQAARQSSAAVAGIGEAARDAGTQTQRGMEASIKAMGSFKAETLQTQSVVASLVGTLGGLAALKGFTSSFIAAADSVGQMQSRLKLATADTREYEAVLERIKEVARNSYKSIADVSEVFLQSAGPMRELGLTTQQTLDLTEAMSLALVVSGANAQTSSSAINQFGKAMQLGTLRGQEFNTVIAAAPRFADALAAALGKTRQELRQMADAGELTIEQVAAVSSQLEILRAETESMPTTVEDAMIRARDAFGLWAASTNEAAGATDILVRAIDALSRNIETVMTAALVGVTVATGHLIKQGQGWIASLLAQQAAARASAAALVEQTAAHAAEARAALAGAEAARANAQAKLAQAAAGKAAALASVELSAAEQALALAQTRATAATQAADAATRAARGTMLSFGNAVNMAMAALVGWQIGTWARNEFEIVRVAAGYLIAFLDQQWQRAKLAAIAVWEGIRAAIVGQINLIRQALAEMIGWYATAVEKLDITGLGRRLAAPLREFEAGLRPTESAWERFVSRLGAAQGRFQQASRSIWQIARDMADYERAASAAAKAQDEFARSGAVNNRTATAAIDALNKSVGEQVAALRQQVATFGQGRAAVVEYEKAQKLAAAATIQDAAAREAYVAAVQAAYEPLLSEARALDALTSARKADTRQSREWEAESRRLREAREKEIEQAQQAVDSVNDLIDAIVEETEQIGLSRQEIERRTIARQIDNLLTREGTDLTWEEVEALKAEALAALALKHAKQNAHAESLLLREQSVAAAHESELAWRSFAESLVDAMRQGSAGVRQLWRRMIEEMKRQLMVSGLLRLFGGLFRGGPGSFSMASLGGMFPGSGIGGGSGNLMSGGSIDGAMGLSGLASGIGGTLASLGGWLGGGSSVGFGAGLTYAGTAIQSGGLISGLYNSFMTGAANIGQGAFSTGLGQMLPGIGAAILAATVINSLTGGRLFGTSFRPESASTTLSLAGGGTAEATLTESRRRSLFRGTRRRETDITDSEAIQAARDLFVAIERVMADAARALAGSAPAMIDAAIRTVVEYDKKGNETARRILVDVMGRTWEEASVEAAQSRIAAEAIIATIDSILGTSVEAAMQTLGEASAIAERWRHDAETLLAGAQFLLAAATDIRAGFGLLRDEGGLTEITDLVERLAHGGEELIQTYARLAGSTALYEQALGLMNIAWSDSREALIEHAAAIADAAGGLDRATALWQRFFGAFFSPEELLGQQLAQAQGRAAGLLGALGLDADTSVDEFRRVFTEVFPTLSAEATVQWLEAAAAIADVIELEAALTQIRDEQAERLRAYADLVADINQQLATQGLTDFQRALFDNRLALRQNIDAMHRAAREAGLQAAREEDLARAHELAARNAARAIQQLTFAGQDLVAQLFGTPLDAINDEIARLEAASRGSIGRIGEAFAQAARDGVAAADALLLGDTSPLTSRQKLEEARRQFHAAVARGDLDAAQRLADTTLRISQQRFGGTQRHVDLFGEIEGLLRGMRGAPAGGGAPSVGEEVSAALAAAYARRDEALAEQRERERLLGGQQLAQYIADLARVQEISIDEAARLFGTTLEDVAGLLGMDDDTIQSFIASLMVDPEALADSIHDMRDAIVEELRALHATIRGAPRDLGAGEDDLGDADRPAPAPVPGPAPILPPGGGGGGFEPIIPFYREQITGIGKVQGEVAELRTEVEATRRLLEQIAANTQAGVGKSAEIVRAIHDSQGAPRRSERTPG